MPRCAPIVLTLMLCMGACRSSPSSSASASRPAVQSVAELVGKWTGESSLVVDWIKQRQVPVEISIVEDGSVTGSVGDATLVDAQLRSGRGDIERNLGWGRDYRIHGKLSGNLVAADNVHRDSIDIVFDKSDETTLTGGWATSGLHIGPPGVMTISAGKMVLRKSTEGASK